MEKPLYMYQAHLFVSSSVSLYKYSRDSSPHPSDVSRNSEISLQCYLRAEQPKRDGDGLAADLGNDIFMGGIKFVPNFEEMGSRDQWYDFVGGAGRIQIGTSYLPSYGQSLTVDDFELITVIGKGSFGKVRSCNDFLDLQTLMKLGYASQKARYSAYICAQDYSKDSYR